MKKTMLMTLAAVVAGSAGAIDEQHAWSGYRLGDYPQLTFSDTGGVNAYVYPGFTRLTATDNTVDFTVTNSPSGWKHTAWLSSAGQGNAVSRNAANYTETTFENPLPYTWNARTDQNGWRAIVARFDPITVTFKFYTAGGSSKTDITRISTNYFSLITYTGVREGYDFKCWTNALGDVVQEGRAGQVFNKFDGQQTTNLLTRCFTASDGSVRHMPGNLPLGVIGNADTNIWLYAVWTGNVYTVWFDANGGKFNDGKTVWKRNRTFGNQYSTVGAPTYAGKTFTGWYTDESGGSLVTDSTLVRTPSEHTLYAHWTDQLHVIFNYYDASRRYVSVTNSVDYMGGTTAPGAEIVNQYPGHAFTGWDRTDFGANVTQTIYVNAQYEAFKYTVAYVANAADARGAMSDQEFTCGTSGFLAYNTFTRTGYEFSGWNTAADGSGNAYSDHQDVFDLSVENGGLVTLYAQWTAKPYVIAFNGGGGEGSMAEIQTSWDEEVVLPANQYWKSGCEFQHWRFGVTNFVDGATVSNLTDVAGAYATLVAVWDGPFWIRFDANGGDGEMAVQRFEQGEEQALSESAFTRTGYTFAGWATNETDAAALVATYTNAETVVDIAPLAATNTLFAVWSTNVYWVAFDANGGEGGAMSAQRFVYDQPQNLTSNAYSRGELWRFDGWSNTVNGVVYADGESVSNLCAETDATNTLLAVWADNRTDLSRAMHCTNLQWNGVVMSPLNGGNLWTVREGAGLGYDGSGSCAEQTGVGGDVLVAAVTNSGTLTFWCRSASSSDEAELYMVADERNQVFFEIDEPLPSFATLAAGSGWQQKEHGMN